MPDQSPLFPFAVNWKTPVTESYEHRTEITTSRSGREQRGRLRYNPRRTFSYNVLIRRGQFLKFSQLMQGQHHLGFEIGSPIERTTLATPLFAATTTFTLTEVPSWIVVGAKAVLQNTKQAEIVEIAEIVGSAITLTEPAIYTWPSESLFHRSIDSRLQDRIKTVNETNEMVQASVVFDVEPDVADIASPGSGGGGIGITPEDMVEAGWTRQAGCGGSYDVVVGELHPAACLQIAYNLANPSFGVSAPVWKPLLNGWVITFGTTIYYRDSSGRIFTDLNEGSAYLWYGWHADSYFMPGTEDNPPPNPLAGVFPPKIFNGKELFLKSPNWGEPITTDHESNIERLDYGFGKVGYTTPIDYRTRYFRATYLGRNKAEVAYIRNFFNRAAGQVGEFYMPTWMNELKQYAVSEGGTRIVMPGTDHYDTFLGDPVNKAVMFRMVDGTLRPRRISLINVSSEGDTQMFIDTSIGDPFVSIMWMPVWRFAMDRLDIEWLTDEVAQFTLVFKTLEELP